ncbi:hypothetical protein BCR35DRAFT_332286 [Leucosporidium creatinivorum]|uniref:RNI-like protein n=1 Tax=Leucosporidium creatinivorum TaxID=106004 RepID=A0A1Y2F638_9BASI|nr:hypothetical protein BCR35DRAFT_332286 [Leucosporidium creatinivorum]
MAMIGGYDDKSSGEEDEEASAINDKLRRTLREAPHLATLVRRIILHIGGQDWHKDLMEHASEALVDLFTNCTGANSLVLHCAQSDLGLDLAASNLAKAGLGTQLVDLSAPMSGSGLLELLTKLPHLRRMVLNLDYLNKEDKDAMGRYTFPFSLEVLYLSDTAPPKFLAALTANSSSSLRHLHIEYCDESLPALSHITALETLSLSFGNMLPYPPSPDTLSTFLAAQPSLHTLHLAERNTDFLDKAFLLRLPSTLTFLDLEKSTALPADVIAYISQPAERRAKNIGLPLGDAQPRSQNKKLKMMRQACREKVSSLLRAQSRGRRGMRSRSLDALDSTRLGLGMDSLFFNEARQCKHPRMSCNSDSSSDSGVANVFFPVDRRSNDRLNRDCDRLGTYPLNGSVPLLRDRTVSIGLQLFNHKTGKQPKGDLTAWRNPTRKVPDEKFRNTKMREMAINIEIQGKEMGLMENDGREIIILIM